MNIKVVPAKKDDKEVYYGEQYDINNKSRSYWRKYPVAVIDKALEELGKKK